MQCWHLSNYSNSKYSLSWHLTYLLNEARGSILSILTLPPKTIAISANLGGTDGPQNAPRARPFTRYLVNFGHEQSILVPSFTLASIHPLRVPFTKYAIFVLDQPVLFCPKVVSPRVHVLWLSNEYPIIEVYNCLTLDMGTLADLSAGVHVGVSVDVHLVHVVAELSLIIKL